MSEPALRIDAHMHWWSIQRQDYGWLTPELTALYRDFGPTQADPLLAAARIDGVILVQAAPTVNETRYLFELARSRAYVRGVVGWADFNDVAQLESLACQPTLLAVRPMLQDLAEDDWILQSALKPALRLLEDLGLPFEALIYPRHLPVLRHLLDRHPRLRVMIDHAAKPDIAARSLEPWNADLAALAAAPQVWCKLSGLMTEARPEDAMAVLAPYVDALFNGFGVERVVWGSDWPVATLRLDYAGWLRGCEALTGALSAAQQAQIFGGNAERFYARGRGAASTMEVNTDVD